VAQLPATLGDGVVRPEADGQEGEIAMCRVMATGMPALWLHYMRNADTCGQVTNLQAGPHIS
jgi:hypothetical protein